MEKIFPVDFSQSETKQHIKSLTEKLDSEVLTTGEKNNVINKIFLCQNHLLTLSTIESNEKLSNQQSTLSRIWSDFIIAEKKASSQAKLIILLTILTLIATMCAEIYHIREENENQKEIIHQLIESNHNIETVTKELSKAINGLNIKDTITIKK